MLAAVFAPEARASLRWLRTQTAARTIPFLRIGHLVFFDVDLVWRALANKTWYAGDTSEGETIGNKTYRLGFCPTGGFHRDGQVMLPTEAGVLISPQRRRDAAETRLGETKGLTFFSEFYRN